MIDPALVDLMVTPVTWKPLATRDFHGKPTFGPATGAQCHLTVKTRMVRNAQGAQVSSSTTLELDNAYPDITEESQLTVEGVVRPIVGLTTFYDEIGPAYTEVYLA